MLHGFALLPHWHVCCKALVCRKPTVCAKPPASAGFNRTGFVVCSYLVQALGMSVNEALAAFEEARPPGVKHERFVKELHRRFDTHRWGSGYSTVGSETAGSVGGFSQSRTSYEGSVGSMHSDFKGVAEHLQQKQQIPGRQVTAAKPLACSKYVFDW